MIKLPRGGYVVKTSLGPIQFGSPPETIKDTMVMDIGVPEYFTLTKNFYSLEKGISLAEMEFPVYYNFFIKQRITHIICSKEQMEQLKIVLNESLFGPTEINLESEYPTGTPSDVIPKLKKEMDYFKHGMKLNTLVSFHLFKNNEVNIENIRIVHNDDDFFSLYDNGEKIEEIPGEIHYQNIYDIGKVPITPFDPPFFGMTCLGSAHGFDPNENTSGFILWVNNNGIMIDPPVNSTEWLKKSRVNPKLISSVILTHCHADHDAGTFQKITEEGKIKIYTTETILDSFLRKYSTLTNIHTSELKKFFDFYPVIINSPVYINGAEFRFTYSLHSIPSMAFRVNFLDQSLYYTSDTLNEPTMIAEMNKAGIFSQKRYEELINFPWDVKYIYHEAGIPPLHTPIKYLASLPKEIKKKITIYHISKNANLPDSGLKIAEFGIENTFIPEVKKPKHADAYKLLDTLSRINIFKNFNINKAKEFLSIARWEEYEAGDKIIKSGEIGDKFYIIFRGTAEVQGLGVFHKRYSDYEYFGEASLVLNQPRAADVVAISDITAITIKKNDFLNFIRDSELPVILKRLARVRNAISWRVLTDSRHFSVLSSTQKTELEMLLVSGKFQAGKIIIKQKQRFKNIFIIITGKVSVYRNGIKITELSTGDFFGDIFSLQKNSPSPWEFKTETEVKAYRVSNENMKKFIQQNPGIYLHLSAAFDFD